MDGLGTIALIVGLIAAGTVAGFMAGCESTRQLLTVSRGRTGSARGRAR